MRYVIIIFLVSSTQLFAQIYNGFAQEIFLGRLPSAKSEAMGRIQTLNLDPYFVSQSNPASLVTTNGISVYYSHSSPFYGYTDGSYNHVGISYTHTEYGGIAINFLSFNTGTEAFGLPSQVPFNEKKYLYTLTYSYDIRNWFIFGVNANLYVADFGIGENYSNTFFEIGLLKQLEVINSSDLRDEIILGSQLKNIFNQSFSAIDEAQADVFPMIFRAGISNSIQYTDKSIHKKSYLVGFVLGFEYQDLLNSSKRSAYKIGGELALFDFIFLRSGFYSETPTISEGNLEDFTYGFGFKMDFEKYVAENFPLIIMVDFTNLEQPPYGQAPAMWSNFTTWNLIANYRLDSN